MSAAQPPIPDKPSISRRRVTWLRCAAGLLTLYTLSLMALVIFEDRLAFPGWTLRKPWTEPPPGVQVEDVILTTSDDNHIHSWWLPPTSPDTQKASGAILYIHGNGENVTTTGKTLERWNRQMKMGVLGIDYPGYGRSTGRPSKESCYAAAVAAFDWLLQEKKIAPQAIIVVGQSMGAAIAIDLVSKRPCRLIVTSGAFTSFPDIAQYHYFWLPARHLVQLRFDNIDKIATLRTPIFIVHGAKDRTVPFAHGERLAAAVTKVTKRFYPMPDHGHSHPKSAEFFAEADSFLSGLQLGHP